MSERLERRIRKDDPAKLEVILDVTRRLMSVTDLDALLELIAQATTQVLKADRATIFLVDADRGELWSKVALGGVQEIRFPVGAGISGEVARTGTIINIPDAYADPRFLRRFDQVTGYRTRNLLTFPMTGAQGTVIGVFQVLNKAEGPFTKEDEETLSSLASSAAVAVENAQLLAAQRKLWLSLVETLAVTIDARDQQTAGHSRRVTRYAEIIGRAMGWQGPQIERLRTAALLHDYGKIAVRDGVLQKPGKLDDKEFAYMKAHAEKTGEFLGYLEFPSDMREVPLIAAQHHERMDGKGYPSGLPASQILPGARIVAAADIFDALTARRYYKPPYPVAKTLEIMDGMAGDHLDPLVVAAVHRALPELEAAVEELKSTWPEAVDAEAELSERDQPAGSR
ncbi:MAG: GAF domain-containing protein [Chloroflexi bacterium]|nr:GAF domain-containing protein [Chloroflexota bacterium]